MIETIIKQPGEVLDVEARVSRLVETPIGVTIAARGLVPAAAALVAGDPQVARVGLALAVRLSGGTDGERYLVTLTGEAPTGELVEGEVEIVVIDATWATPDGGAPWLSIAGFVDRFTLDEVVRMTDADGSGRIGRALLVNALVDAQAIAEAELASRYALPLATVPRIVAMAIADLARARLYPRGAPDGVAEAAKAATRTLERIGTGAIALGLPAADVAAAAVTDAPVLVSPGRRQYPDGLGGY